MQAKQNSLSACLNVVVIWFVLFKSEFFAVRAVFHSVELQNLITNSIGLLQASTA